MRAGTSTSFLSLTRKPQLPLGTRVSSPPVLIFPTPSQEASWLWGTEQESGRADLIRSLSARDRRLIALLLARLAWPGGCAHGDVCVCVRACACVRVRVCTYVCSAVWPQAQGRLKGGRRGRGWVAQDFSASSEPCLVWCAAKRST